MMPRLTLLLLFATLMSAPATGAEAKAINNLPDVGAVIRRFIERATVAESNRLVGAYVFYRTNITEQFSRKVEITEMEELLLRVTVETGEKKIELIGINGREPTAGERERELKRFSRRREGQTGRDKPDRSRHIEAFLTSEILSRYVFTVQGREWIEGRPCLIVSFKPGTEASNSGKVFERILDRIGGIFWIDEAEYELVKADIRLREKVSLWGGFLGALEQLHMKILRTRDDSGRWQDRAVEARFVGRAVTRHIDVKTRDLSSAPQPIKDIPIVAAD